ncbi:MAG: FmdE family protein [Candidatus Helarchaeota archaeon]
MKDEILKMAIKFHGHLGPFLVLGLKMGEYAKNYIKPVDFKDISAEVTLSLLKPPESCILDGIQISSGCTIGKRNLIINESETPSIKAIFKGNNREIIIKVKEIALGVIRHNLSDHHGAHHHHESPEDLAKDILEKDFESLFDFEKSD